MRLKDKVAIVTGAASGLGASTAKIFAKEGAKVVVADLLPTEGKAVVSEITSSGDTATFCELNVKDPSGWDQVVRNTLAAYEKIDVLVNNAGVSGATPDLMNIDVWDQQMEVNARGVFLGMRAVVPAMRDAGGGSIINTSSMSGFVGQDYVHMGYNAAKGAVRLATKAAAVQFAPYNIRVNSVHPGVMPPMRSSQTTSDPQVRKRMIAAVPLGREGRVQEVAFANLFLASDEAAYIT
ncbi:uncharacterized protein METZ01_LOCUS169061, partial [marine metagenome]